MGDEARPQITAASLRAFDVWQAPFPGSILAWEEEADEGDGIGFDGIDPSAMVRALFRTHASWDEVLEWYRKRLDAFGWQGREVKPHAWWVWWPTSHPGTRFDVMDQGQTAQHPGWPVPEELVGMTAFEVLLRASGRPGVVPGESSTFRNA